MPRISAEERSASMYRAGGVAPVAPDTLTADQKKIWRDVVSAKPADWFDTGNLALLRRYCWLVSRSDRVTGALEEAEPGSERALLLIKELTPLNAAVATFARQLRLTVQAQIGTKDRKITEKGSAQVEDDALFVGKSKWQGRQLDA